MASQEGLSLTLFEQCFCSPDHFSFSGKTSLIHSLAGELGLDIYVVSLSSKGYECCTPTLAAR